MVDLHISKASELSDIVSIEVRAVMIGIGKHFSSDIYLFL